MNAVSAKEAKATLDYRVVAGINPKDPTKKVLRPLLVNKDQYDTPRTLHFAMDNGYIIGGQFFSNYGVVNGFLEACQKINAGGDDVLLNRWLRIHPEATGTIDPEVGTVTAANGIHMCVQAQVDLRRKHDDYVWHRVDGESVIIKVETVTSPGGNKNEVTKTKAIVANGKNLSFNAAWGDSVTVSWFDAEGTEHTLALTPSEQSATYLRFDWPTGLADVPANTELTFSFRLHAIEGGSEQYSQVTATLVAA